MIAGITVLPARLTRIAPAGTFTSAARPTCTKRPPLTTMEAFSIGGRVSPTITRAPSKTVVLVAGDWPRAVTDHAALTTRTSHLSRRIAVASTRANSIRDRRGHSRPGRSWKGQIEVYSRPMRLRTIAVLALTTLLVASLAWAQFRRGGDSSIEAHLARPDSFDGQFHYCRAVYRPNPRGDGGSWLTDYPLADIDLSIRLSELTKIARQLRRRPASRTISSCA